MYDTAFRILCSVAQSFAYKEAFVLDEHPPIDMATTTLPASWFQSSGLYQLERRAIFLKVNRCQPNFALPKHFLTIFIGKGMAFHRSSDAVCQTEWESTLRDCAGQILRDKHQPRNQAVEPWRDQDIYGWWGEILLIGLRNDLIHKMVYKRVLSSVHTLPLVG